MSVHSVFEYGKSEEERLKQWGRRIKSYIMLIKVILIKFYE